MNNRFRVIWLNPAKLSSYVDAELNRLPISKEQFPRQFAHATGVALILAGDGSICVPETAYVAACGQRSRSVEQDTQRTYAESIVAWLNYAAIKSLEHQLVGERDVQEYRNSISRPSDAHGLATATVSLRVGVVLRFFKWCQVHGWASSPLGTQLLETGANNFLSRAGWRSRRTAVITLPRIRSKSPRPIDSLSLKRIAEHLPQPHQLVLMWGLTTGLRRAEICRLTISDLERAANANTHTGPVEMRVLRKGGKEQSVFVLQKLIDETWWYIHMSRPKSLDTAEYVFLTTRGTRISKNVVSRRFKLACDAAGIRSTFHGLRHTFALNVLDILERQASRGAQINPLKTLQVLLGHSSLETTDIYLQSLQVMSPVVEQALDFLYGKVGEVEDA